MRVTYLGQACILVEGAGRTVLTDPWLTEGANLGSWFHAHLLEDAGISPDTVASRRIDYLYLSHEHQDHVDPETLRKLAADTPVLICKFPTDRFRRYVESLGLTNIRELVSGEETDLGDGLKVTIFGTAEYTNDSAILIEAEGVSVFNETDCKLSYEDYTRLARHGIDIGFYMFSGANWYPIMYDFPEDTMARYVKRRRASLLNSFTRRVKTTMPRHAVPAAGPCAVLDPAMLSLNSPDRGIFIDPRDAVATLEKKGLEGRGLYMAASDVWDSTSGIERHSPAAFHGDRWEYLQDASRRMAGVIARWRAEEKPAGDDLSRHVMDYFEQRVRAQSAEMRGRIGAKLLVDVSGPQGGSWTVDFTANAPPFVREGVSDDWTYRVRTEDKLIYPFMTGTAPWLEDLFLSLRVHLARRPDIYNEPLYYFLYDPDPERLSHWYATH